MLVVLGTNIEDDRKFHEVAVHCNARLVTENLKHFPKDGVAVSVAELLKQFTVTPP